MGGEHIIPPYFHTSTNGQFSFSGDTWFFFLDFKFKICSSSWTLQKSTKSSGPLIPIDPHCPSVHLETNLERNRSVNVSFGNPLPPLLPGELATYAWLAVYFLNLRSSSDFYCRHGLLGAPIMKGIHSMEQRKKVSTFKQWTNSPITRSGAVTWSYFNDLMKILKFALNSSHLTHMEPPRSPRSTCALS